MSNEALLILNLIVVYGSVILWYYLLRDKGLFCWTVLATVAANIEVMILVDAFGMQQTLGNILFASTFLVTDILSELYGKKHANTAVNIGILTSLGFIVLSQFWLHFTPAAEDIVFPHIVSVFTNTPRVMIMGLVVYAVVQKIDVWLYHYWWSYTSKKFGSSSKYLWIRNNGSTMISQLLNTILFTIGAFYGVFSTEVLVDVIIFSYVIFFTTSLLDTPFVYLARYIHHKRKS